jgi:hypothetical protein
VAVAERLGVIVGIVSWSESEARLTGVVHFRRKANFAVGARANADVHTQQRQAVELRSTGQPRAAAPTCAVPPCGELTG